ncbi:thiaminase /4-amino-5-aminomethyl-2-methylpyrimidine deaminase [Promicromonospora sp. AC04]|uniref:TenA family protein n=1 Tax=Promicromonospora sp. AC04 TaxID=2135723 RepID=UPI000D35A990|nr:TenA family protein [Promicromonospora sp. AC04]PUB31520.1 thiaminase /4-amino-5-aminomethyl-2-methylpyrimidine deaminase [Promicromonospora sp. AC04]
MTSAVSVSTSTPAVPADGAAVRPFTEEAWERIAGWRDAVDRMPFVRALAAGSLPAGSFAFYLSQDAAYLREYSRVLARAAQLAPDAAAQGFLARSSVEALEVETALHRDWLGTHAGLGADEVAAVEPSPVTAAYTGHLHAAASGTYAETVAALLPCFWLYAHVGSVLVDLAGRHPGGLAGHPYAAWIGTYGDEGFQESTRQARLLADAAARWVSPEERARMLRAFEISSVHEYRFFEQGLTCPTWPTPPTV